MNGHVNIKDLLGGTAEIRPEDVHFDPRRDRLGGGTFGDVYRAELKGIQVAVKIPKKQDWESDDLKSFRDEVAITRSVYHTNVVLFLGACTIPGSIMIVTECMACDMATLLHKRSLVPTGLLREPLTLQKKLRMAHDAALGVIWLHDVLRIVHRDLKPANLLLDLNLRVKVGDFGFSEIFKGDEEDEKKEPEMKGTALYAAPEIWKQERCTVASDVYSFGIILWEILTEEEPFPQYMDANSFYDDVVIGGIRPTIPPYSPLVSAPHVDTASFLAASQHAAPRDVRGMIKTPDTLVSIITQCWDADPSKRPSMRQVHIALENALLECQLSSTAAREFWKKHFTGEEGSLLEEVEWYKFSTQLAMDTGAPLFSIRRLQPLLALGETVTRGVIDNAVKWFGDFFTPEQEPIINEMCELVDCDWFCGDITKDLADRWLTDRENLVFLVRTSNTDPRKSPFTISKRRNNKNLHRRVQRLSYDPNASERYSVEVGGDRGTITAKTLPELIAALRAIKNIGAACPKEELVTSNPYEATMRPDKNASLDSF